MNRHCFRILASSAVFLFTGLIYSAPVIAQLPDGFSLYDRKPQSQQSKFDEAMTMSNNGEYKSAANALKPLADAGHLDAQYRLAVLHFEGKYVTMTDQQAVALTRKAATQGHSDAQELMTLLVINGFHKLVSHEEANIYHTKLAQKGRAASQYHLGLRAYHAGDMVKARLWLETAAAQGHELATGTLAELNAKAGTQSQGTKIPSFPVFADSRLNELGDAAASCFWVLYEKQKDIPPAQQDDAFESRQTLLELIYGVLHDPKQNGGFGEKVVEDAIALHILAARPAARSNALLSGMINPQQGPTREYCESDFFNYMNAFVTAKAGN